MRVLITMHSTSTHSTAKPTSKCGQHRSVGQEGNPKFDIRKVARWASGRAMEKVEMALLSAGDGDHITDTLSGLL